MGYIDTSAYTGTLTTHNTVTASSKQGWWTVNMTGAFYGGTSINSQNTTYAIVDTGTSFLLMAQTDY